MLNTVQQVCLYCVFQSWKEGILVHKVFGLAIMHPSYTCFINVCIVQSRKGKIISIIFHLENKQTGILFLATLED